MEESTRAGVASPRAKQGSHVTVRDVTVLEAAEPHKAVVRRLLELYGHDFSEFTDADVDEHGRYGYPYLDAYWSEPERHPFLFRVDRHWAGFALVRSGAPHDMAEFFVLRKYRRHGIGHVAARECARAVSRRMAGASDGGKHRRHGVLAPGDPRRVRRGAHRPRSGATIRDARPRITADGAAHWTGYEATASGV